MRHHLRAAQRGAVVFFVGAGILVSGTASAGLPPVAAQSRPATPCTDAAVFSALCGLPPAPLSAAQARAALAARGYRDVRRLAAIGDYWQGQAMTKAGRVTVYALDDGQVLHAPPEIGAP